MSDPAPQPIREKLAAGVDIRARDGNVYRVRTIRQSDWEAVMRGYDALTDEQKWLRVLHTLPHLTPAMAHAFAEPSPDQVIALVVEGRDALAGELVGSARVAEIGAGRAGEFSVTVRPQVAGLGLARQTLQLAIEAAREAGCRSVWGTISAQNGPMLRLARRLGMSLARDPDDGTLFIAELDFTDGDQGSTDGPPR